MAPVSASDCTPSPRRSLPRGSTAVVVCRAPSSSGLDLETRLERWQDRGWQVRRREPRVVEGVNGPTHGVLLVLQREAPAEHRLCRRPIRRPINRQEEMARRKAKT